MSNYKYIEVELKGWNDLFMLNQSFLSYFVFRGQGDASWPLETSLRRMIIDNHGENIYAQRIESYERQMIEEFMWKYPSYQSNPNLIPNDEEALEWLSLMQHYGAKTRLLDFTQSLYVALYMALYGSNHADAFAIWGINCHMIDPSLLRLNGLEKNSMYGVALDSLSQDSLSKKQEDIPKLFIFRPQKCNERIIRQQGLFVMPSTITQTFESVLSLYCCMQENEILKVEINNLIKESEVPEIAREYGVIKFIVPNAMRYEITRALEKMNISAETMYPGLAGLAQSVNRMRFEDKL